MGLELMRPSQMKSMRSSKWAELTMIELKPAQKRNWKQKYRLGLVSEYSFPKSKYRSTWLVYWTRKWKSLLQNPSLGWIRTLSSILISYWNLQKVIKCIDNSIDLMPTGNRKLRKCLRILRVGKSFWGGSSTEVLVESDYEIKSCRMREQRPC